MVNLNDNPDLMKILARGDFDALHYVDTSGDGWVIAECPQLQKAGLISIAALSIVGLPDFPPNVTQRDLMLWWRRDVPEPLRAALWAIPPFALSQTRIAADVELPVGFSIEDDTVTQKERGSMPSPILGYVRSGTGGSGQIRSGRFGRYGAKGFGVAANCRGMVCSGRLGAV